MQNKESTGGAGSTGAGSCASESPAWLLRTGGERRAVRERQRATTALGLSAGRFPTDRRSSDLLPAAVLGACLGVLMLPSVHSGCWKVGSCILTPCMPGVQTSKKSESSERAKERACVRERGRETPTVAIHSLTLLATVSSLTPSLACALFRCWF